MSHQFAEIMFTDNVKTAQEQYGSRERLERFVFIDIAAFDWNCPQYITQRYTELEWAGRAAHE